jgi:uncharacterized protein YciI
MPYIIETWDKPDHLDLRLRVRQDHIRFLESEVQKLLAAGAKLSDDGETMLGTIYIVDVETREEAEEFVSRDPFTIAGLPQEVKIRRWRNAFFNFQSNMHNIKL